MNYDVIIIGAGPGGIFTAYELVQNDPEMKVAVFEAGQMLHKRRCPVDGDKVKVNDDTLLYGVEVKFYNMEVCVDNDLQTCHKGLYIIGDGSGITHSLSHASASGIHVARSLLN